MYDLLVEEIQPQRMVRNQILSDGNVITFELFLELLSISETFRAFFNGCLADSPFDGFRWETPELTVAYAARPFEYVLVNSPGFYKRKTDANTFRKKFDAAENESVLTFANLRGDATMIVPAPVGAIDCYGHLASFVTSAPVAQVDQLWKVVGRTTSCLISDTPVWLSTAGGGVAWLHVRMDSTPKYYNYGPYRNAG